VSRGVWVRARASLGRDDVKKENAALSFDGAAFLF
jgi:hypothetical protein